MRQLCLRVITVVAIAGGLLSFPARPAVAGNLQPDVTLSLAPSTQSVQPGSQFTVSVFLNMPSTPAPHEVDFISMKVHWDPAVLTAVNFQPVNPPFSTLEGPVIDNTTGTASLVEGTGFGSNFLETAANVATLTFQAVQGDHTVTPVNWVNAQVLSASPNDQASENVVSVGYGTTVCVDSALPTCQALAPAASIPLTQMGTRTVKVRLAWGATDADGVTGYQLQQSVNGGAFTGVTLPSPTATTITQSLKGTTAYQYQAQYTDGLGNTSMAAIGPGFEFDNNGNSLNEAFAVRLYDDVNPTVVYSSGWTSTTLTGAYLGDVHSATNAGEIAQFAIRNTPIAQTTGVSQAQSLAWVSTKGPDRGKAQVWLDGTMVATVNLYAAAVHTRQVVWSQNVDPSRDHVLEVHVLGTKSPASTGTRVDVDAFVVLR